ncbi:MAG: hypothetical protein WKF51_04420 [Geodermatophilaceae bacterium]
MSGDENNNWLNSDPVKGDAKDFLGGAGGSGINVRPDGLKRFSTQAEAEAKNFVTGYGDGVVPLAQAAAKIGGSFQEAAQFSGRQGQAMQKTAKLSEDVFYGVSALGMGARTIAINYLNGDATSAATLPQVLDAFDASKGNGLRDQAAGEGQRRQSGPSGNDDRVRLPEAKPVDPAGFTNPNDPGLSEKVPLGDDANYTVPGTSDPSDVENADPQDDIMALEKKFRDDLAHQDYEPAPYDPDDYR